MPSPIIARADALMHRKRQNASEFDDIPVLTDAIDEDEDDDIPVLTETEIEPAQACETVPAPEAIPPEPSESPRQELLTEPPHIDPALRDQLVFELTSRIEQRIKAALPQIISSTVRDFLAEQEMIKNN